MVANPHRPLRRLSHGCWAFGILLAASLAWLVASDVVLCDRELRSLPEPATWRTWPVLPDLGGYRIDGKHHNCVGHGMLCATNDAELRDARVCPRSGLSLDNWFGKYGIYASRYDIQLRTSDGTFVAAGHNTQTGRAPTPEEEVYLGAFRPITRWKRPAFASVEAAWSAYLLAFGIAVLLRAGKNARRHAMTAARARAHALVEAADGSYRVPPSAPNAEALEADALIATARACSSLRLALWAVSFLFVVTLFIQLAVAMSNVTID